MTRRFLNGAAGDAVCKTVRSAETGGSSLELALEVAADDLRSLPWETLRIPGEDGTPSAGRAKLDPVRQAAPYEAVRR